MSRFQDRVVLVTGGAQGIGRAVAERFLAEGASVFLFDLDSDRVSATTRALGAAGGRVDGRAGDVACRSDVRGVVQACMKRFGRLDVLISNAGIADVQPLLEIDDASWQRILDVNLTGAFLCTQEAARVMGHGGAIVVTASTNAFYVESNLAHYNASKGGVVAFVRSAALDLAPIRVNAVEPGVVRTRLAAFVTENASEAADYLRKIPLNRFAEPLDVAHAVLFLASDEASYITGQALVLDGGLTLGLSLAVPDRPLPGSARANPE